MIPDRSYRWALIFNLLMSSIAYAIEPTGPSAPNQTLELSIRQAVDIALKQNPDVASAHEKINEADASRSYAVSQLFPNLQLNAYALSEKDPVTGVGTTAFGGEPYNKYQAQLKLTQPLYSGGALLAGLSYTKKDKSIKEYDLEVTARDLTVSVIQSFYSVFTNKQVISLLYETQAVEKESLATAEKYYRIGRGQLIDVLQTKAQIAMLNPQIANAENQMKAAVSQLSTLLHENQTSALSLTGSLAVVEAEQIRALMPTKKVLPEIAKGETQISQFEDKKDLSLATYYPNLSLQGTFGQTAYTKSRLFNEYSSGWTLGVYLTIPIFSGLASIQERHILEAQANQLWFNQQKLLDTLSYQQTQAERDLSTADTVLVSSKEAAKYAKDSLKEAQKDFRLQTINYLQFLTSQQNYLTAQLTHIQAQGNYITTLAKYCAASGISISKLVDLLESKKEVNETN